MAEEMKHSEDEVVVDYQPDSGYAASGGHSDGATARDAARSPAHDTAAEEAKAIGSDEDDDAANRGMLQKLVRFEREDIQLIGRTQMSTQHMRFSQKS